MTQPQSNISLQFKRGTIVCDGLPENLAQAVPKLQYDARTQEWRAEARHYRDVVTALRSGKIAFVDDARKYAKLDLQSKIPLTPRRHQTEALAAWVDQNSLGVVQMPTGAGKTILAVMAILTTGRPTLVIVPTIDLVHQWQKVLSTHIAGSAIGALGGGARDVQPVTVATYDSALLFVEQIGHQFGLLIVDECHHLPSPQYQVIARAMIAPFRLGLSATVDRTDGKEAIIFDLLGPLVHSSRIDEMQANILSPYDVVSVQVSLSPEERDRYQEARSIYTDFIRRHCINFASGNGWSEFLWKCSRFPEGRGALRAYREQKRLAQAAQAKMVELWRIFQDHNQEKIIVFTNDNELAYRIGREFILPVLTHQTKLAERKKFLASFRDGTVSVMVTSKVLNEGVDVPDASVGVVVSGSGAVREHVQRLGRILRHKPGKRATLYELVARGTSELSTLARRRQHHAYQGPPEIPR